MPAEHTDKRYEEELKRLREQILYMGGLVEDQIQKSVKSLVERELNTDAREEQLLTEVRTAEARLQSDETRPLALMDLRRQWKTIAEAANRTEATPERRMMRRVLAAMSAGVTTSDSEYLKIIAEFRMGRGR